MFKNALLRQNSREFEDAMSKLFKYLTVVINIANLLYTCTPDAIAAALVDRTYKNELVTQLFPFRV